MLKLTLVSNEGGNKKPPATAQTGRAVKMGSLLFCLRGAGLGDGFGFGGALLELVHATGGIHKFLLAGVKGMRGAADAHLVQRIFLALKGGRFLRGRAGAGEKFLAIARVAEDHRTVFIRMNVLLHKSGRGI